MIIEGIVFLASGQYLILKRKPGKLHVQELHALLTRLRVCLPKGIWGHDELLRRSRDPSISDYVVMFFRFVTSGEIRKRSEFFEPFILGLTNASVEQFCKSSVEPMGEESDHVQIIALSDALGVPIRVVYLDRSSCENNSINVNHHDFVPTSDDMGNNGVPKTTNPSITLLYRPGHYDILYPK